MNMKDYEKQAEELTKQAQRLEATMLTYRILQDCVKNGFDFEYWLEEETKTIRGMCGKSGIYFKAENYTMWFDEKNEEGFGDLAGLNIEDIDLEEPEPPSQKISETDEKPKVPLENEVDSSGAYRVDVSGIIGKKEE
tara:strand:+ start:915 stop:1325 length:411 start_codon:yes stop_codon:yes gene_type:complete